MKNFNKFPEDRKQINRAAKEVGAQNLTLRDTVGGSQSPLWRSEEYWASEMSGIVSRNKKRRQETRGND